MLAAFSICAEKLSRQGYEPAFQTNYGCLYQGDCLPWLKALPEGSVHTVFADPPFNLGKNYGKNISDSYKVRELRRNELERLQADPL